MANIGVFGGPLNKLVPEWPGKIRSSKLGSTKYFTTNSTGSITFGNSKGQKGDESHWVPFAPRLCAYLITRGIKYTGGNHQLLSSAQLQVDASTASVPGVQNLELNLSIWAFVGLANLSTVWGPQTLSSHWNTAGCSL